MDATDAGSTKTQLAGVFIHSFIFISTIHFFQMTE